MECSAKEGDNIKNIFISLARKLQERLNLRTVKVEKKGEVLAQPVKEGKVKKCC